MRFPNVGLGESYAATFARAVGEHSGDFPNVPRGQTLLMAADFGGENKGQRFETYAFLFLDIERNQLWLGAQPQLRIQCGLSKRRMEFKSLGDVRKRKALIPFLRHADIIEGILIVFAITKGKRSLFDRTKEGADLLGSWKPAVQEKLLRVLHLSGFFCAALSHPNQDLMWFIDEDAIAANDDMLAKLTKAFAHISSQYLEHDLRRLQCGTARCDSGTLQLEDTISIPDLAAGAFAEIATKMTAEELFPRKGIITPLPRNLSWKSQVIGSWLAANGQKLRRRLFILEILEKGSRLTHLGFRSTSMLLEDPY